MPLLYFSKVNINSNIYEVYEGKTSVDDIMRKLFNAIDDMNEYEKIEIKTFTDQDGEEKIIENREKYNFSELTKHEDVHERYIYGKIIRRVPVFSEFFDENTRISESVVHENNSVSILFYFDMIREIIVFSSRLKFGYKQFNEGFQNLINQYLENVGFEIFLIKNPFSIKERLKGAHKITKIKATSIPPNVNEEELKRMYSDDVKEMRSANVTKKTSIFEIHEKSKKGINLDAEVIRRALDSNEAYRTYSDGYGKLEVEGQHKDGTTFLFDSDVDSPYQVYLEEKNKNNVQELMATGKSGITIYLTKKVVDQYSEPVSKGYEEVNSNETLSIEPPKKTRIARKKPIKGG